MHLHRRQASSRARGQKPLSRFSRQTDPTSGRTRPGGFLRPRSGGTSTPRSRCPSQGPSFVPSGRTGPRLPIGLPTVVYSWNRNYIVPVGATRSSIRMPKTRLPRPAGGRPFFLCSFEWHGSRIRDELPGGSQDERRLARSAARTRGNVSPVTMYTTRIPTFTAWSAMRSRWRATST